MTQPLAPDRLRRLLDEAVQPVTACPGTFDRICRGVRRRHVVRRCGVALLAALTIAGGSVTGLTLTLGGSGAMPPGVSVGQGQAEQAAADPLDLTPMTEGKHQLMRASGPGQAGSVPSAAKRAGSCRWAPPARPPLPACPR